MIIEGAISVKAALLNGKRDVSLVYISSAKKTKDLNFIRKIAKLNGVPLQEMDPEELGSILKGKSHGGVGAQVSLRRNDEFTDGDIFTGSRILSISAMPCELSMLSGSRTCF